MTCHNNLASCIYIDIILQHVHVCTCMVFAIHYYTVQIAGEDGMVPVSRLRYAEQLLARPPFYSRGFCNACSAVVRHGFDLEISQDLSPAMCTNINKYLVRIVFTQCDVYSYCSL